MRLAGVGIGSCFVGSLGREEAVRARFGLPNGARIGAFLIFGTPSTGSVDRAISRFIRLTARADEKLSLERIFFAEDFEHPSTPPDQLAPILEAARNAPSATNAQPWRFLWRDGCLHLFVKVSRLAYYGGPRSEYRLYDGGICMGNVLLALEALGTDGRWELYDGTEAGIPEHPEALEPLGRLVATGYAR